MGSEMCIRDRLYCMYDHGELNGNERLQAVLRETEENDALGGDAT